MKGIFTKVYNKKLKWSVKTALLLNYTDNNLNFTAHQDDKRHKDAVVAIGLSGAAYIVISRDVTRVGSRAEPRDIVEKRLIRAGDMYALSGAALQQHYHAVVQHPEYPQARICLTLRDTFTFLKTEREEVLPPHALKRHKVD